MNAQAQTGTDHMNPLDAYFCEIPSDPCVIVMFGASGDLARRKLLPALFDLARHACLAPRFRLLGFARTKMSDQDFREHATEFIPKENAPSVTGYSLNDFMQQLLYFPGSYDDLDAFRRLGQRLDEL